MQVKQNISLKNLNTFGVEASARFFVEATKDEEVLAALEFARKNNLPVFILGGGSNVLLSDKEIDGLVIQNKILGLNIESDGTIEIGAGEDWDHVAEQVVTKNMAGIECLSGVPGSAGGAVVQNIGAYGQTLGDTVSHVEVIEIVSGQKRTFDAKECEFGYRKSLFKVNPSKYVVTRFEIKLKPDGQATVSYPHVKKHFEKKPNPSLAEVRQFIIRLRANKGYVIMPGYESYKTAGSFFKNPIVNAEQFELLKPILGDISSNRYWEIPNGVKIAAAFLMQEAGFAKGYREGNVGISPKHSLSLVNFDGARATELKMLADDIQKKVFEKFGVKLEEEVLLVGKFD
jgi:UDP-N-acetylmuramate dehydrogenase